MDRLIVVRQSANAPAMISIARGNEECTLADEVDALKVMSAALTIRSRRG